MAGKLAGAGQTISEFKHPLFIKCLPLGACAISIIAALYVSP